MKKKILLGSFIILAAIQFARPAKNLSSATTPGPDDVTVLHPTPPAVKATLARACYDCHSDHTRYPWYAEVQPVGWWIASHVSDGKRHLNFSQFGRYDAKRATRKMNEVIDEVNEHEMPLSSYTLVHRDAVLSDTERDALENWARGARDLVAPGGKSAAASEK